MNTPSRDPHDLYYESDDMLIATLYGLVSRLTSHDQLLPEVEAFMHNLRRTFNPDLVCLQEYPEASQRWLPPKIRGEIITLLDSLLNPAKFPK